MAKITSAYASKLLKQLSEDKDFWVNKENSSCLYTAAEGEDPVIPEYDYEEVAGKIEELDSRICRIKHAVNLANVTSVLEVNGDKMTVDTVLVRMAQLNKRKTFLDYLRKQLPKTRTAEHVYSAKKMAPEYRYINYDLEKIKAEYERISEEIMNLQIALDKYNQTFEFEVEL